MRQLRVPIERDNHIRNIPLSSQNQRRPIKINIKANEHPKSNTKISIKSDEFRRFRRRKPTLIEQVVFPVSRNHPPVSIEHYACVIVDDFLVSWAIFGALDLFNQIDHDVFSPPFRCT